MENNPRKPLTEEEQKYITEAYNDGMKCAEIAKDLGRNLQTVCNYLDKTGLRPIKRQNKTKEQSGVKCPKCRRIGHTKGARFCYHCGADIRTEADILRERVGGLFQAVNFLPANMRNETCEILQAVISYLGKQ